MRKTTKTTWIRTIALAAISIPALASGRGPLPAGHDDASYSAGAPEARIATGAGESGTWGPKGPGYDDATYAEGVVDVAVPPMLVAAGPLPAGHDDATYGGEPPIQQVRALAQAIASVAQTAGRQAPTQYDPIWPDGLAPGEEGEGWAAPEKVRVAGTQYDPTAPDGNVPEPAGVAPSVTASISSTSSALDPAGDP